MVPPFLGSTFCINSKTHSLSCFAHVGSRGIYLTETGERVFVSNGDETKEPGRANQSEWSEFCRLVSVSPKKFFDLVRAIPTFSASLG